MAESIVLAERYRLESLIGRGGMGEVWRGHDLGLDRAVAVKILAPQVADAAMAARFAREGRAAARIAHPNVVAVFDVGEDAGRSFLVMELLTGRSLADELAERGRLDVADVRDVGAQVAAGLGAAHQVGVVHRDIKPANLHRVSSGAVKVLDFGIARLANEQAARLTSAGTMVGTAQYFSPEQARGQSGGSAADLYALGCVLYELLAGRPPFSGSTAELVSQHLTAAPLPLRHHRPDVPPDLEALVLALLAKDPSRRPANAEAVHAALTGTAATAVPPPAGAAPPTAVQPQFGAPPLTAVLPPTAHAAGPASSRRPEAIAGVIGAVVLVAGSVWILTGSREPTGAAATPSAAASAAASPSATQRRQPPAPGSAEWLTQFRNALTQQQRDGGIEGDEAKKTSEKLAEVREKYAEGKREEAAKKLREIISDLAEARRDGKLSSHGPLVEFLARSGLNRPDRGEERDD